MTTGGRVPSNHCDIVSCWWPSSYSAHIHCPCQKCNGRAVSRSTEYRHWNDAIILMGQTIDRHVQAHHQTTESGAMRFTSFINLLVHYADLAIEELPTDVVGIDATEGVEDTTQQLPINITDTSNNEFHDCSGSDNLQEGSDDFQHSESADLMEINHENNHKSIDLEHDILVAVLRAFQCFKGIPTDRGSKWITEKLHGYIAF